jgi:hypothetical protein
LEPYLLDCNPNEWCNLWCHGSPILQFSSPTFSPFLSNTCVLWCLNSCTMAWQLSNMQTMGKKKSQFFLISSSSFSVTHCLLSSTFMKLQFILPLIWFQAIHIDITQIFSLENTKNQFSLLISFSSFGAEALSQFQFLITSNSAHACVRFSKF